MKIATQAKLAVIAFAAIALVSVEAFAGAPGTVHVEGFLHTTGGGPVADGNYNLTFSLYGGKTGGSALWSEAATGVPVKGGQWARTLGVSKAIKAATLTSAAHVWLGVKVGNEPELPRLKVHSAMYALSAGVAQGLDCTGCVTAKQLNLAAGSIKAKEFVGDGSKLTGIKIPSGKCPTGKVVSGIDANGKLICGSASPLPDDGVDKVSQGLIAIVGDLYLGNAPVNINDNNPKGSQSVITLKNVGKVDKLTVTVGLSVTSGNSGIDKLKVCLIAPGGAIPNNAGFNKTYCTGKNQYLLHDLSGAGKKLLSTWPSPTKEVNGNIAEWIGKDPSGNWTVQVVDTNFDTNKVIGKIEKFQISARTTGNNKVNVVKEMIVDGEGVMNKGVKLGMSTKKCDANSNGLMRYVKASARMEFCDGSSWRYFGHKPATYRWAVWSTYNHGQGSWQMGNRSDMFGGVNPSSWTDGNACASSISANRDIQQALFNKKGYAGSTANVWSFNWRSYSSTNSMKAGALFRVKNTTSKTITWKVWTYQTAWVDQDRASVSVNGSNIWCPSSNYSTSSAHSFNLSIPANRTSTVIFVSGSTPQTSDNMRGCVLAFYNNSLKLPAGLAFVDDLETAPHNWNN